ncbi:CAP domain-containing protein [Actinophytocola oryzae]|uniref:Cysteine-rich secretory protein family protein n=1 Tax=Actinophytocola oryzae TaxID=502181 RepID=A0A4R7W249_9PSEU|nr:CAP domain-containing protein [Actinophytocola oryzae]TDV56574.1 Cysteine-rich secretory protein family protein [Actinophytocola oryzae]
MKRTTTIAVAAALGLSGVTGVARAASSYGQQVIALTNDQRAAHGCGRLAANNALGAAARGHSGDMARHSSMSHEGTDGSDPGDRITGAGYPATEWAENVAYGQSTPKEVVTAWMDSPGHRANILNCELAEIGVGRAVNNKGVAYWTQDFGARG